jgi:putative membrane protein
MRPFLIPAAVLALLTFCSPDRNRQNAETGMAGANAGSLSSNDGMPTRSGDSAGPAGEHTPTPAGILSELRMANSAEIRAAGAVARQATAPQVKQAAKKLVADHTRNLEQLRALAQKLNLTLISDQGGGATTDSTALPPELQGSSGAELDNAFIQHEIEEHQANIEKIRTEMLPAAQNEQMKTYLQKTVSEMKGHLAALKRVEQQLSP